MNDKFRKLIDEATRRVDKVADLWDYSTNCEYPTPATLFLDLVGYSLEEYGTLLIGDMTVIINKLGQFELSLLGEALDQYATHPLDVTEYFEALLAAETGDDE
jgi:hypothetical protein